MIKLTVCSGLPLKTCSLCNKSSEPEGIALICFGEWMVKKEITVHYYCLLLSTHLPQRGEDHSGILGFLLRDIRTEVAMAKMRKCKYCFEMSATIQCDTCKNYFHLTCGHTSQCLSQFVREFKSYCHACIPQDQYQMELLARKQSLTTELCFICTQLMGTKKTRWIYAKCCGNGFTHLICMKSYALSAGYYLTCIWCRDKRFREDIKYLGVFVPDRDANWEKEKCAYVELYRSHKRCDMEICKCPKGRDFSNASKWQIITCKLCGAFGAHNPICIPGLENSKEKLDYFKCDVCSVTEQTVFHKTNLEPAQDLIDTSLYVSKEAASKTATTISLSQSLKRNTALDNKTLQEKIANDRLDITSELINNFGQRNTPESIQISTTVYALTQSPQTSQSPDSREPDLIEMGLEELSDSDDNNTADFLVETLMNIFDGGV